MDNWDDEAEWWRKQDRKSTISICVSLVTTIAACWVIAARLPAIS